MFETDNRDVLGRGASVLASLTPIPKALNTFDTLNAFREGLATTIDRHLTA